MESSVSPRIFWEVLDRLEEGVGIVRLTDRRLLYVNRAFAAMHGYEVKELVGQTIDHFLVLDGSSPEELVVQASKQIEEQGLLSLEIAARRRSGELFDAEIHLKAGYSERDEAVWTVEIKDITDRKKAEAQLKLQAEILAGTPDFVAVADATTTRITYMNRAGRVLAGLAEDADLERYSISDFVPPDSGEMVRTIVFPTAEQIGHWAGDLKIRTSDGSDAPVLSVIQAHRDEQGRLKYYSNVSRSITERIHQQEALARSAAEFEDLYNHAPCGYHSLDSQGIVVRINDLELKWLGYTREEVVGKFRVVDLLAPAYREVPRKMFARLQAGQEFENLEVEFKRKDGSCFPVLVSATALRDEEGRFLRSRTTVVDLSQIKRLENERNLAQRQLEHASRLVTLGEMAAGMAHEINQPLGHIALTAQLIRKLSENENLPHDELVQSLNQIEGSIDRMTRIIQRVQQFGRHSEQMRVAVDLNLTLRQAVEMLAQRLKMDGIQVEWSLSEILPHVLADPNQLEQVWINQLTNARDALLEVRTAGHGERSLQIGIRSWMEAQSVWVEFEDNGAGMTQETQEKLFQPFYTTKPPGRGTGLGLPISFSIIKTLGGTISVESERGKGTRFKFQLPLSEVAI